MRPEAGVARRRGHAVIELSLLMPWVFFLFVGALDFGFYSYALIATENAAHAGALYTAQCSGTADDQSGACERVLAEMSRLPNASDFASGCSSDPLRVTAERFIDGEGYESSRVRVSYQTVQLIPIPGLVSGRLTITRTAEVRVFGD